jgi:RecB family exonuclease
VRTYIECPSKYFIRYVLGFPAGNLPSLHDEENELHDAEYPAELRGRVFHAVMERASELLADPEAVFAAVQSVVDRTGVVAGVARGSLVADVAALVKAVMASETWSEIQAGSENACEYSISAALGDDFLTGTIDRLYRAPDGCWTILDYKTDAVGGKELYERAETYWPQLDFYAVMVSRLKAVDKIRLRLLFASQPQARLERMLTHADLRKADEEIALVIAHIKAGEFAAPQRACPGCPFSPEGCRALRHVEA